MNENFNSFGKNKKRIEVKLLQPTVTQAKEDRIPSSSQQSGMALREQHTVNNVSALQTNMTTLLQSGMSELQPKINSVQLISDMIEQHHLEQQQLLKSLASNGLTELQPTNNSIELISDKLREHHQKQQDLLRSLLLSGVRGLQLQPNSSSVQFTPDMIRQQQQQQLGQQRLLRQSQLMSIEQSTLAAKQRAGQQIIQQQHTQLLQQQQRHSLASIYPTSQIGHADAVANLCAREETYQKQQQQYLKQLNGTLEVSHQQQRLQQSLLTSSSVFGKQIMQSANPPLVVPSLSTPLPPSELSEDSKNLASCVSSLSIGENIGHPQTNGAITEAKSFSVDTPAGGSVYPPQSDFIGRNSNEDTEQEQQASSLEELRLKFMDIDLPETTCDDQRNVQEQMNTDDSWIVK